MAKEVIREVVVDPPVPPEYVVFRRADIERFIAAAHRTVARLEAELAEERSRADIVDLRSGKVYGLPDWTERVEDATDNVSFFESLREPGMPLIAGAEQAHRLA